MLPSVHGAVASSAGNQGSGEPMPNADLPGWSLKFTDDFNTPVALGGFVGADPPTIGGSYPATKWGSYPRPYRDWEGQSVENPSADPAHGGWYDSARTVSTHDSVMDIWLHTETVSGGPQHLVAAMVPLINSPGSSSIYQLYGRYAARIKITGAITTAAGFKSAWLLWPQSDVWPNDNELDFPEGDHHSTIGGFVHYGTVVGVDNWYALGTAPPRRWDAWHTVVIEWKPNYVRYLIDGVPLTSATWPTGEVTSNIAAEPHRWVLQNETQIGGAANGDPPDALEGHVLIDWVAVWSYAP